MNPSVAPDELLSVAVEAAQAAGQHALRNRHRRTEAVGAFRHDVKLRLDLECQATAERVIRSRFPGHGILGEEDAAPRPAGREDIEWIIDPIDGTVNFSHGLPLWNCSIAVRDRHATLAGVVYAPALDECFTATVNGPALLNGQPIRVSTVAELGQAVVCTGLDKDVAPEVPPLAIFQRISERIQRARILGSAALDICSVACGRADGFFEAGIYLWDIAAGDLIVRRAGGQGEILRSQKNHRLSFLATNGLIHAAMKDVVTV